MQNRTRKIKSLILAGLIIVCAIFNFGCNKSKDSHLYRDKSDNFSVHYLSVGQGDCIFMEFSDGKTMLIDCGENNLNLAEFIVKFIKELQVDKIDYFLLSHPDSDHTGNANAIIENFSVETIYIPDIIDSKLYLFPTYSTFLENAKNKNLNTKISHYYNYIQGKDYFIGFLSPSPSTDTDSSYTDFNSAITPNSSQINAMSPIIYLEVLGKRFLFTGDATKSQEQLVLSNYQTQSYKKYFNKDISLENIDFLKVGHHGGEDSTSLEFLTLTKPKNAIISVGGANNYGHPSDLVLERLQLINEDIGIYRTDYDGTISVEIDKNGIANIITDKYLNNI